MLTGIFDLRCRACSFVSNNLNKDQANRSIAEHRAKYHGSTSHIPDCAERLPRGPIVGDRVRIKGPAKPGDNDLRKEFEALYGRRAYSIHVVETALSPKLYGEDMFQLQASGDLPRILVRPNQLELAWKNDDERRAGLAAATERAA